MVSKATKKRPNRRQNMMILMILMLNHNRKSNCLLQNCPFRRCIRREENVLWGSEKRVMMVSQELVTVSK